MQLGALRTSTIVIWVAAACGGGSTAVQQPPARAEGPAPALRKVETPDRDFAIGFEASGLPAVTGDAANVALAVMDVDGPMSPPNLRLSVRDRTDAQVHEIVVLGKEAGNAFTGAEGTPPFDDTALVEANRYLAETHAQRGWFPLAVMTLDPPREDGDLPVPVATSARSGGVALRWDAGTYEVTVDGKVVASRSAPSWLAPPQQACEDCEPCSNPSYLGSAWLDAERKLIVASIAYVGTDSCWEPSAQEHVIAWE